MSDATPTTAPRSVPRGLATVAFLKARFDLGVDHIDMFMPLVTDTISALPSNTFTCRDVQQFLSQRHGLAMPQHTLVTLLNRAAQKKIIKKDAGRYIRQKTGVVGADLQAKKLSIEAEQSSLAKNFQQYAAETGHLIPSEDEALRLIFEFLEDNEVGILLGADDITSRQPKLKASETRLVAAFAQKVMVAGDKLSHTLQTILEGLVVYNAAFLKDVTAPAKHLTGLRVFFDSRILFQLLGYEGDAAATLARETLQLLRNTGVQCLAFDKTVFECRGVLRVYENKLGTTQGAKELWPTPMTRYFLIEHYGPADMRQMAALLPQELAKLGIQVAPTPKHLPKYTLDEKKLAEALADDQTHDLEAPRVVHDVDCAAAILTLRKGQRSASLSHVRVIFATSSGSVLTTVQDWFAEQGEGGIGPVVHIRALSNLIWLRRPALAVDLKAHELIALCSAALQPSRKTWDRFIQHLNSLEKSKVITSDEAVAIVVSEMTDDLLSSVDATTDDNEIVDVTTLDEVVSRVRSSYEEESKRLIGEYKAQADSQVSAADTRLIDLETEARRLLSEAEARERATAEDNRQLKITIEGNATLLARIIGWVAAAISSLPVIVGAIALIIERSISGGIIGISVGIALVIFVLLEMLGILGEHVSHARLWIEGRVLPHCRRMLGAEKPSAKVPSVLGLDVTEKESES